jgi:hypothetical protein
MAVFLFPSSSSPTTTLSMSNLAAYPFSLPKDKLQSTNLTPGGTPIIYNLGPQIEWIRMSLRNKTQSEVTSLSNFIENVTVFRENTFTFVDDRDTIHDSSRFWIDEIDFQEIFNDRFDEDILIRIDP